VEADVSVRAPVITIKYVPAYYEFSE